MNIQWILASGSPRRKEILSHLGLHFTVVCADVEETSDEHDACRLVEQLAQRKAHAVKDLLCTRGEWSQDTVILAADTVVSDPDGIILGKPHDEAEATRMLRTLSGRTHAVVSGISLIRGDRCVTAHERTDVTFAPLTDRQIARYVASGEPMDKAGAYGLQDTAALWVTGIRGDYFNVVGLPVHRLEQTLNEHFGLSLWE